MGVCPCAGEAGKNATDVFFTSPEGLNRLIARDFDEIFNKLDKNNDGHLDKKECQQILGHLSAQGLVISAETGEQVIKKADSNHDGKISQEEFRIWIQKECFAKQDNLMKIMSKNNDRQWLDVISDRAFKSVDKDGNGSVNTEELATYLEEVSKQLGDKPYGKGDIEVMLQKADTSKDGKLSKQEFRSVMKTLLTQLYLHKEIK